MRRALTISQYALLLYLILALIPVCANIIFFHSSYATAKVSAQYWQKTLVESLAREIDNHLRNVSDPLDRIAILERQYGRKAATKAMHRIMHIVSQKLDAVYITDNRGYVLAADFLQTKGGLVSNFIGMRLTGTNPESTKASWTRFFLSAQSQTPTVRVSVPAGENRIVGDFNLSSLKKWFSQIEIPPGASLFLVDEQGKAIFPGYGTRALPVNPLVGAALQGQQVLFDYGEKERMTGASSPLEVNDWHICLEQPKKTVMHIHNQLLMKSSIVLMIVVFLLALTLLLLHYRLIHPLGWIIARSKEIPETKLKDTGPMPAAVVDLVMLWETLRSSVHRLEQREQNLLVAQKEADAANRAKSTFLAKMGHELRTPLNGILGYTQQLNQDQTLGKQQHSAIDTIHECGEHLLLILNDVLDFAKIEADKMELTPTYFRLDTFLHKIAEIFRYQASNKQISFVLRADHHLPQIIEADQLRLRQVLFNLLDNAVKFTDHGEVSLTVTGTERKGGKAILHFSVVDTGPGISREQHQQVFKPFTQMGERLHYAEGMGLGLAISWELVQRMGGNLLVESPVSKRQPRSEQGPGCRFFFIIEVKTGDNNFIPETAISTDQATVSTKTILIDSLRKPSSLPPPKYLNRLMFAAAEGDVDTVGELIETIGTIEADKYKNFADRMHELADNCQFSAMEEILKKLTK